MVERGVKPLLRRDLTARPESAARDRVQSLLGALPETFDSESEALLAETAASADRQYKELTDELFNSRVNSQNAPSTLAAIAYHAQEKRKQKLWRNMAILEAQSLGLPATKIAHLLGVTATSIRRWRSAAKAFAEKLEEDAEIDNTNYDPELVCRICDWATVIDSEETEAYTKMYEHWRTADDSRPDQERREAAPPSDQNPWPKPNLKRWWRR